MDSEVVDDCHSFEHILLFSCGLCCFCVSVCLLFSYNVYVVFVRVVDADYSTVFTNKCTFYAKSRSVLGT